MRGQYNSCSAALDAPKQAALLHDLEQLWIENNLATSGENPYPDQQRVFGDARHEAVVWLLDRGSGHSVLRMGGTREDNSRTASNCFRIKRTGVVVQSR